MNYQLGKQEEMALVVHHLFGVVDAATLKTLDHNKLVESERVQMPGFGAGSYQIDKITPLGRRVAREIIAKYDALQPKEIDDV